ncbi:MAG TPA: DUF1501 domain-containing protein [Rectinemataceae bacterium]|nr:DUF1501 domain-containing protein [Rectinemataceae bacterium]
MSGTMRNTGRTAKKWMARVPVGASDLRNPAPRILYLLVMMSAIALGAAAETGTSGAAAATAGVAAPVAASAATPAGAMQVNRTLVLIELAGGNDGLNTVVPWADPLYASARPGLALAADSVLKLNASLGLHPALAPLLDSWKAGDMAIVLGVGYPNPNRSHFRSIAIWESASGSDRVLDDGWLARLAQSEPRSAGLAADSLILGETHPGPLAGAGMHNITLDNLDGFLREASQLGTDRGPPQGGTARIYAVEDDISVAAAELARIKPLMREPAGNYPDTALGRQLKLVAQLLAAGLKVPYIKLTLRGFDTHSDQLDSQARLLGELASAVAAFRRSMIEAGTWNAVLVMTYSEFGRRVAENGSGGTDHGTAAPLFLWGGRVRGGFVGTQPSLSDLDQGDLKYTTDYRNIYRSIADQFLGVHDAASLERAIPGVSGELPLIKP